MKKTIVLIMAVALLMGTVFAINNQTRTSELQSVVDPTTKNESEFEVCFVESSNYEMYYKAFTYIMNLDSALNTDMEYIAMDYKHEISIEDKQHITNVLESYGVNVFEAKLEELSNIEYSDDYGNLHGILIIIEDIEISENITISFTKYRSGIGSISSKVNMIQNENGEWEIEESDEPVLAS